jgi:hypothetical protein
MGKTTKVEYIQTITVDELADKFGKGKFATVVFKKKSDGSTRILNGKTSVKRGLKGGEASYDAKSRGQLRVFDVNLKENGKRVGGYRSVTASNVEEVRSGKVIYKVQNVKPVLNFVQSITHESRTNILRVVLNGVVYRYFEVPRSVYLDLIEATNKGEFFNQNIRNAYGYLRVS